GRVQRDSRTAAAGDPGAATGRRAARDEPRAGPGNEPATGVQAPAGPPRGWTGAGPRGREATAGRPGRPRAAADPRMGGRFRAVLERDVRSSGRVCPGIESDRTGGNT